MGQATADLPDPLEERPEPAGNNDELLSQLAGEEIDRLLADDANGAKADLPAGESSAPGQEGVDSPAPQAADSTEESPKNLGTFLNDVDDGKRPAESILDAAGGVDPMESPDPVESLETDAAERAALEVGRLEDAIDADPDDRPAPLLLRPLVWINAPLDILPEGVRAGVGKVAIVTFFNAMAILIYLLIFRT